MPQERWKGVGVKEIPVLFVALTAYMDNGVVALMKIAEELKLPD